NPRTCVPRIRQAEFARYLLLASQGRANLIAEVVGCREYLLDVALDGGELRGETLGLPSGPDRLVVRLGAPQVALAPCPLPQELGHAIGRQLARAGNPGAGAGSWPLRPTAPAPAFSPGSQPPRPPLL